ncbi:MAG: hypothetical protein PHN44_01235 [Candidatus Marinimicrobia bacterium]|nr:hypothetical protein [Candidatus Neomarinimicrobiota bacterium]MDD5539082.1 hypothetical protein [Candidatus Neomarinimicrobiota bacterium]
MKTIEVTYSGDSYHDFWAVVEKGGELFAARCDAATASAAEVEATRTVHAPYTLVALARVGHTAYNQVGPGFINAVASAVLEVAAKVLNIKFAEAAPDAPQIPGKWVGEEFEEDDEKIAKEEAALELACEEGRLPGAMPADI